MYCRLTLNEAIELVGANEQIVMFPPEGEISEEDSGKEDFVSPENLPGSLLRAEAELDEKNENEIQSEDEEEYENNIAKKAKMTDNWHSGDIKCNIPPFQHEFQANLEPLTPLQAFEIFFPDELIRFIVDMSNRYAMQNNEILDTNPSEMKCFLAVLILSSYSQLPCYDMYWETSDDIPKLVSKSIRRDRFRKLKRFIYVCDNMVKNTQNDKLFKLRPLISLMNKLFMKNSPFEEFWSIDESMVPYYGCLIFFN